MKDRLIELLSDTLSKYNLPEHIADELLANGVIVPPCKVGDVLYLPTEYGEIIDYEIETILYGANNEIKKINCCHYYCDGSGYYTTFRIEDIKLRTLYRSKEEAEKALKECKGK